MAIGIAPPNGRALSRAALESEKALQPESDAKIALILWPRSGVGYSAVLDGNGSLSKAITIIQTRGFSSICKTTS
jgi:hypothetical protein